MMSKMIRRILRGSAEPESKQWEYACKRHPQTTSYQDMVRAYETVARRW